MKNEPDIIKELRAEEKLGKLGKLSFSNGLEAIQKNKEDYQEKPSGTINIFDENLKNRIKP